MYFLLHQIQYFLSHHAPGGENTTIGRRCTLPADCEGLTMVECDSESGTCQCMANYIPETESTCVASNTVPNQPCTTAADCTTVMNGQTACINDWCRCATGHVPANATTCVPIAVHIGDACVVRGQCTQNFVGVTCRFSDGTCQCEEDLVRLTSMFCTEPALHIGDECLSPLQCRALDVNTECVEASDEIGAHDVCLCKAGFEAEGDVCRDVTGSYRVAEGLFLIFRGDFVIFYTIQDNFSNYKVAYLSGNS